MKFFLNLKNRKTIKSFPANASSLQELLEYTRKYFESKKINMHLAEEYQLLVEEVTLKLIENANESSDIIVETHGSNRDVYLKLKCFGEPITLHQEDEFDYGGKLIGEYKDYLKQRYLSGSNQIIFEVSSDSLGVLRYSFIAAVTSTILALLLNAFCTSQQISFLVNDIVEPINYLFVSFLSSLATPMIFFSIAALITKLWLNFENNNHLSKLFIKYLFTAVIASSIGFIVINIANNIYHFYDYSQLIVSNQVVSSDMIGDFISQFSFDNIISPFQSSKPIPMISLAVVTGVAASTIFGKRGIAIRHGIASLSAMFEKMFNIVYKAIPFFLVFSILSNLLSDAHTALFNIFEIGCLYLAGATLMIVVYVIQLLIYGVNPISFWKEYKDVILNNLKIGSNISALPYNKRVLAKKTKLKPNIINEELKLGTIVDMDGSCLVIATFSFYLVYAMHMTMSPIIFVDITIIAILISIGSSNQPGSFLLGVSIIIGYLGLSTDLMTRLIVSEVLLGTQYSTLDCIEDIVTIAGEDAIEKKKLNNSK